MRPFAMRLVTLETGEALPEKITGLSPQVVWAADNRTLLYVANDPTTLLGNKVRKHVLGASGTQDPLVYEEKDTTFYIDVYPTKDERYLVIQSHSTLSTEARVAASDDPALHFNSLIPRERDHEYQVEHVGNRWIIRTNWQAKNFRMVEASEKDVADRKAWRDLLANRPDAFIDTFDVFSGFLAVQEHSNGLSNVRILPWQGKAYVIDSPEPAYTMSLGDNAELNTKAVRYTYTSLTTPLSTYDLDTRDAQRKLLKREAVLGGFDQRNYVTEHRWAVARDGTKVPVSIAYRAGLKKNRSAPLFQYGYGSYGASTDPEFSYTVISLLDRGFVYAIAHIRGGQEMGRDWYENGKLLKKRNTFNDFIDVTRYLVREKYVAPDRTFALSRGGFGIN